MESKENKITLVLQNFIDELSKGYGMSEEERQELFELASEDTTKLYNQKDKRS